MSSPKNLLDQRLAKGEISIDEYNELIALLAQQSGQDIKTPTSSAKQQIPDPKRPLVVNQGALSGSFRWVWVVIVIVISGLFWLFILAENDSNGTNYGDSGLSVGNLDNYRFGATQFNLANTSERSGDVLLSVSAGNIEGCEHVVYMKPGRIDRLRLKCSLLQNTKLEQYKVHYIWASDAPAKASAATRIEANWHH